MKVVPKKCLNCGEKFIRTPDPEYEFRYVHENRTCPYEFDFAHDDLREIEKWIVDLVRKKML